MPGHRRLFPAKTLDEPRASSFSVGHCLQGGESLRGDYKQRLRRVEVTSSFHEINPVDVRNEPKRQAAVALMFEGFVGHSRPKVRAADSDINDISDALACIPFPLPAAHAVAEDGHFVENGLYFGYNVLSVELDGSVFGSAQGDVQNSTILRQIDPLSAKHRI